jgi:hypothetical protein
MGLPKPFLTRPRLLRLFLAAAALGLLAIGTALITNLREEGFIGIFVGGCLWWTTLFLGRSACQASRDGRNESVPSLKN